MATQTHKKRELLTYGFLLAIFLGLALAYPALATEYKPLVGIPGLPSDSTRTLSGYVNIVYLLTISIGALIAFLKITIAGVKYSLSDVITDKGEAKKEIMGALFGLAILLIPFLVLNTIYGGLININILDEARPVNVSTSPTGSPGGVQVGSGNPSNPVATTLYTTVHPRGTIQEGFNFTTDPNYESICNSNGGKLYYGNGGDNATCIYIKPEDFFGGRLENCATAGHALRKNIIGAYNCEPIPAGLSTTPFPAPPSDTSGQIISPEGGG